MNDREQAILTLLLKGYSQSEITTYFREHTEYKLKSLSSIEKLINLIKKKYGVRTLFQLGAAVEKYGFDLLK